MKKTLARSLICLLAGIGINAAAQQSDSLRARVGGGSELRSAAVAPMAIRREEARREEAIAGRRLTAEERADLRELLRRQWAEQTAVTRTAESLPAERIVPGSAQPRIQRN